MSVTEKVYDKNERLESQYEERTIEIRRVTKVTKGGRGLRFSALVVVGDKKSRVGMGRATAKEVSEAIKKAIEDARKNLIKVHLNNGTIFHETRAAHGASSIFMKPASEGTGIIAGGAMRQVLEVLGVQNILAKCLGSTNSINVARATLKGLSSIKSPQYIADKRGKSVAEILGGN